MVAGAGVLTHMGAVAGKDLLMGQDPRGLPHPPQGTVSWQGGPKLPEPVSHVRAAAAAWRSLTQPQGHGQLLSFMEGPRAPPQLLAFSTSRTVQEGPSLCPVLPLCPLPLSREGVPGREVAG